MARGQSLQDPFLNALRKERVPVSIYLVNGIKLQGQIDSFDQFVVLLRNSVSQMVYKHAISTVVPARNVRLPTGEDGEVTEPADRRVSGAAVCNCLNAPGAASVPILVGVGIGHRSRPQRYRGICKALAASAGAQHVVLPWCWLTRARPDPKYFVGSGKAEEIKAWLPTSINADCRPGGPNAHAQAKSVIWRS